MSVPGDFFDDKDRFVPASLLRHIFSGLSVYDLVTPITERGGDTIWRYHDDLGIFKPDGIAYIKDESKKALGTRWKTAYVNEVVYGALIEGYIQPTDFVEEPGLVIVKNGVLHLDTMELTDHDPAHYAKAAMPITYDPDATCWETLKFLDEVIPDAVDTFQEWLGYHLYKDMIYHKAAMFIGDGANGKTTLQDVMNAFLGYDNVSHVNLYRLIEGRFSTAELYLKLANISPEIASGELKRTGTFKSLTGHDRIMAERKYRDPFYFINYAKLTFLCNQLPTTPDQSSAFFRRWLIFVFPNTFEGDACDHKILEKLTTPEELSGLLNWALVGLHRLQKTGHFTKSLTADELQELYESMSDPITAFIETRLIQSTSGAELKDDVYRAYYKFCRDKGYVAVTKRTLTTELKPRIAGLGESDRKIRGRSGRCWTGIRLVTATQATIATHPIQSSTVQPRIVDSRYRSVVTVASVAIDPSEGASPPHEEDQLFDDARKFLEVNGGTMLQRDFFGCLTGLGYNQQQASKLLRTDARFVFRGLTVTLMRSEEP